MEEICELVAAELKKNGFEDRIPAGAVITGGAALIEGTAEVAEKVLQLPVRIGSPKRVGGLTDVVSNPAYSTAVGLVLMGMETIQPQGGKGNKKRMDFSGGEDMFNNKIGRASCRERV